MHRITFATKDWIANGVSALNGKPVQKICLRFTSTSNFTSILFIWMDNKTIRHLV